MTPSDSSRQASPGGWARAPLWPITFAIALASWQVIGSLPSRRVRQVVPTLTDTAAALRDDISSGVLWSHGMITLQEIVLGFLLALFAAALLGLALGLSKTMERLFYPGVVVLQSLPKVAIAPILLTALGFGTPSKVATAALIAFFPILVGVLTGLRAIRRDEQELMMSVMASKWQTLWMVQVPRAVPSVMAGVEVGVVFAITGAIVAEFVGAQGGLGYLIAFRATTLDTAGMYSALIILSTFGLVASYSVKSLSRRIVFWQGH